MVAGKKVIVLQDIEPETGIVIKEGAVGTLYDIDTPTGWAIFETHETGNSWDIAIEDEFLQEYFSLYESEVK